MKNILLILVGGTICTALNEKGNLSVNEKAGILLQENYYKSDSPYVDKVKIEPTENLYILSENMTIDKWNVIIETYRKYVAKKYYDGIIMAHGTDTLAYSAALFSILLSETKIPVFLVSANENLKSERSNGNANFRCAVECICRGISPNVYVPYKNLSDNKMYIHLASRLKQCENYTEDFHSVGELDVTQMTEENYSVYFEKIDELYPQEKRKSVVDIFENWKLAESVLYITPYVGINYAAYNYNVFSAVLHGTFHSGTACAEKHYGKNSILYMLDECLSAQKTVDVYFAPSILRKGTYETVSIIGSHEVNGKKARFMYGTTYEMAYAKLVIAYSLFKEEDARNKLLYEEHNFEMIDGISKEMGKGFAATTEEIT